MALHRPARFARFLGNAFLVLLALGTLGSFFPGISVLGELGPVLSAFLGPWVTIVSLIGAFFAIRRWRRARKSRTLMLAGMATFAALGSGWVLIRQFETARANGVTVSPVQMLFAHAQSDDSLEPISVNYTQYEGHDLPLDIYRPTNKPGGKPAPIFVYIHGGGWGGQTLRQREADYRWFAERGYLVISLEYTLSSETRHTWNVAEPQLGCAMAWINANASRFGGDPARLALWGESAGGNLVLNLSYRANAGTLRQACPGTLPHVAATIALYPVVDPARMYRPDDPLLGIAGRMMGNNYTGGSPEQFPERYAAISSTTHINAKAPPTLLVVPEADHLVAPEAAYAFETKARSVGIETRLIKMPYAEHAFDLRSGSIGNQIVRQTMLQFLEAHELQP